MQQVLHTVVMLFVDFDKKQLVSNSSWLLAVGGKKQQNLITDISIQ